LRVTPGHSTTDPVAFVRALLLLLARLLRLLRRLLTRPVLLVCLLLPLLPCIIFLLSARQRRILPQSPCSSRYPRSARTKSVRTRSHQISSDQVIDMRSESADGRIWSKNEPEAGWGGGSASSLASVAASGRIVCTSSARTCAARTKRRRHRQKTQLPMTYPKP
jgi:hypothetical protein